MLKNNLLTTLTFLIFLLVPHLSIAQNITLINTYPTDSNVFLQGLEFDRRGHLLYSSGKYGQSEIGYLSLNSQPRIIKDRLDEHHFAEGLTVTPYGIWQVSWHNQTAFLRDIHTLKTIRTAHYLGEGWGLAYDTQRHQIWLSNGSHILQTFNPKSFAKTGEIKVFYQNEPVTNINELEFANGFIYANIWQTNSIIKINPSNGEVVQHYDLSPWIEELKQHHTIDTLNGIAHIHGHRFLITGKYYPIIWEMELH